MTVMTDERKEQEWMLRGACRGVDTKIFFSGGDGYEDAPYPPDAAKEYCDRCPVQAECLAWALEHNEKGVWGGTTEYQRRQLGRKQERTVCPGCSSDALVVEGQAELCLACGVSWTII